MGQLRSSSSMATPGGGPCPCLCLVRAALALLQFRKHPSTLFLDGAMARTGAALPDRGLIRLESDAGGSASCPTLSI